MSTRSITACIAMPLLLLTSGQTALPAAPAASRGASALELTRATNSPASNSPKPRVEVFLCVGNHWRRVELNTGTPVLLQATGEVEGTNRFELSIDGRVVATAAVPGTRPRPIFGSFPPPDKPPDAQATFFWSPKTTGQHALSLKVTTATKEVFTSEPIVVEAAQLQRPTLRFLEQPPTHLLTTETLNLVLSATTSEGTEIGINLTRDELNVPVTGTTPDGKATNIARLTDALKEFIMTNSPLLSLRGRKLPPGIHRFEAQAMDDRRLSSQPLTFTCIVDPVERPGTPAPASLLVETATLPGQSRPRTWRPTVLTGGHGRIAGAADALQLHWQTPTNGLQTAGTLIQRLDPAAQEWRTILIAPAGVREWRDRGLSAAQYYQYRIAFMWDDESRSPFSPAAGESTCPWTPSYGVIEIPSGRH